MDGQSHLSEKTQSHLKILLVEDDYVDQKSFMKTLGKIAPNYTIDTADSVATASEKIESNKYNVIVTDYFLPDGTGLDIISRFNDRLFIFITGSDQTQTAIEAMKAGAKDYLIKDYNLNYLNMAPMVIEKIYNNYLDHERAKEAERSYIELFENANDMIQSVDNNGKFLFVNPAWKETMGYSSEEIQEMHFTDIIHPDFKGECDKMFDDVMDGAALSGVEIKFLSKSGKTIIAEGNITPRQSEDSSITSSMSIFRDITEKKIAEEKLQKLNEELELKVKERTAELRQSNLSLATANHELDTFLYRSSHNLMGPIARFEGLINLLSIPEGAIDRAVVIEKFMQNSNEMRKLITKLTDVSRISSFVEEEAQKININQLIEKNLNNLNTCPEHSKIVKEITPNLEIESSDEIINIIISNLIENAFHFKSIERPTLIISISSYLENGKFVFVIEDNGIGIKDEVRDNIYDMFFKGSDQSTGNGLGMYLVKKSMEKLGGDITLETEPNTRTKFRVQIPV